MKYKHKPELVEAYQYVYGPIPAWVEDLQDEGKIVFKVGHVKINPTTMFPPNGQVVMLNEWLVKDAFGRLTSMPDIEFRSKYEVVEDV